MKKPITDEIKIKQDSNNEVLGQLLGLEKKKGLANWLTENF